MVRSSKSAEQPHRDGAVVVPLRGGDQKRPRQPRVSPPKEISEGGDPVTGLPGRERFYEHLRGAARRRRGDEHAWAAVAVLEGARTVSDREGRRRGEELIRDVAIALRATLRDSDKLARLGDEEFGLLIDAPYGDEAMAVLSRLVHQIREMADERPVWQGVSLSVGVTQLWSDEPDQAMKRAHDALRGVRSRGGGTVGMSTGLR